MQTSGFVVAVLVAALVRVGLATDDPRLGAAEDATCASCDGQAVELLQRRVSAAGAGRDAEGAAKAAQKSQLGSEATDVAKAMQTFKPGSKRAAGAAWAMLKFRFGGKRAGAAFDCDAHPRLCTEPFNCNGTDVTEDLESAMAQNATGDGPNFQTWCPQPVYEDYMSQCIIDRDLVGAGRTYHDQAVAGVFGPLPGVLEGDASYCFIEGFCLNTAVTNDTTVEEATHMCDQRYGDLWRTMGPLSDNPAVAEFAATLDWSDGGFLLQGFPGPEVTTPFAMAACMMGNYHCDAMMCKVTHCQDQEMVGKYGHFLTDLGWDENTEPWFKGTR